MFTPVPVSAQRYGGHVTSDYFRPKTEFRPASAGAHRRLRRRANSQDLEFSRGYPICPQEQLLPGVRLGVVIGRRQQAAGHDYSNQDCGDTNCVGDKSGPLRSKVADLAQT